MLAYEVNLYLNLHAAIATVITQVCCWEREWKLFENAPTSGPT